MRGWAGEGVGASERSLDLWGWHKVTVGIQKIFDVLFLATETSQGGVVVHPSFPGSPEKRRDVNMA